MIGADNLERLFQTALGALVAASIKVEKSKRPQTIFASLRFFEQSRKKLLRFFVLPVGDQRKPVFAVHVPGGQPLRLEFESFRVRFKRIWILIERFVGGCEPDVCVPKVRHEAQGLLVLLDGASCGRPFMRKRLA